MIAETDQALAALLKTRVIGSAPIDIAFNTPGRPWIQSLKTPTVNVFLFDVRENVQRRESAYENVRDEHGVVVARRPPMQRWDLHYTITVFVPNPIVEHKVLGAILRVIANVDVLPADVLPAELAQTGYPILVKCGGGPKRTMLLNYAGEMKSGIDVTVTVPIPPVPAPPPAPPVQQPPTIQVEPVPGADPARTVAASETAPAGPPRPAPTPPPPTPAGPPLPTEPEPLRAEVVADAESTAPAPAEQPPAQQPPKSKPAKSTPPPKEPS